MVRNPNPNKHQIYLYALAIFVVFFLFYALPLAGRPFYTRGEGREALVVQSMFEQNNFILPLRGQTSIPSKPPMFHWLGALCATAINHLNEFAIRLPSPLCAALTLAVFFYFTALVYGAKVGLLTVLIAGTSLEWFRNATHARVDACFSFWLTVATWAAFYCVQAWQDKRQPPWFSYLILALFGAGSVLSKGPAGLLIPWLIALFYLLVATWPQVFSTLRALPYRYILQTLLISIILSGLWYYLAYRIGGDDFIAVQLVKENVSRLVDVDAPTVGHSGPFYESFLRLLLGFLPWSIFIPLTIVWLWTYRRNLRGEDYRLLLFMLCWLTLFVFVVSISRSKREVYLLPAYLPLALLTAYALNSISNSLVSWQNVLRLRNFCTVLLFFLTVILCVVFCATAYFCYAHPYIAALANLKITHQMQITAVTNYLQLSIWPWLFLLSTLFFLAKATFDCGKTSFSKCTQSLASALIILLFFANTLVLPAIFAVNSPRPFVRQVLQLVDDDQKIFEFKKNFYAATFYLGRKVFYYNQPTDLPQEECFLLAAESDLGAVAKELPHAVIVLSSETNAANGSDFLYLLKIGRKAKPSAHKRSI